MSNKNDFTILALQNVLFNLTDPNIITSISDDGKTITASNISENSFANISVVTNNPKYNNGYFYLSDIQVYLDNELFPTTIYGLYPIVYQRIAYSDTRAFIENKNTNQPFINGFKNGITIGQLVDKLSTFSISTPNTYGKIKKFVLKFDPTTTSSCTTPSCGQYESGLNT
jgi:hypothetical protein